jgi:hypothetical protein
VTASANPEGGGLADPSPSASGAATATAPSPRRLPSRTSVIGACAALATIIGVLSSSTSLFDWFKAKVNPVTPLPAKIDARMMRPTLLDPSQPLGAYLSDTNQSIQGLDAYQLAERGYEFLLDIHLQGDQGQHIVLRWSLIDAVTGNPLPGPTYNQDAAELIAHVQDQERQWPIWVPSPPRRGRFVLRTILLDNKRRPLAEADSRPFTLTKAPSA